MKKILMLAAPIMMFAATATAQQTETYQSYINVNGYAEREVVPNEIYVRILINEADSRNRVTVAEQETKMISRLTSLGINVDKDLQVGDMAGDLKSYTFRRDRVQTQKSYILKVGDADTLARVFEALGELNISEMGIVKATRNDLEEIKMELRAEAMRNARAVADTLAEAIGQKAGKAFVINDGYGGGGVMYYDAMPMVRSKGEAMNIAADTGAPSLEFQNLKLSYSVSARFVLE